MSSSDDSKIEGIGAPALIEAFSIGQEPSRPIQAESPAMRSLAISSAGPPMLQRPASFGKPPPLGIERPRSISRSSGSFGLKREWDNACTSWTVRKEDLEPVPEHCPLERNHRCLHNVEAQEVATRISEALRANSIQSEFITKPPKAKCKTLDFVSFRIRLYAGDESGYPVIVEMQRRSGPAACFMHACRVLLNAAEGKNMGANPPSKLTALPFRGPVREMKCLQMAGVVVSDEEDNDEALTALNDSVAMIRSKKRDSNVLGLENLCAMTDPIKTKFQTALRVSKLTLLAGENIDVREDLMAMIERDVFSAEEGDIALTIHADLVRQLALTVFANASALCSKDGCLRGSNGKQQPAWFTDNLLPCLVSEIKRATVDECCATQATICVNEFAGSSEVFKQFLLDQGVVAALRIANEHATECNKLLEEETRLCLKHFV